MRVFILPAEILVHGDCADRTGWRAHDVADPGVRGAYAQQQPQPAAKPEGWRESQGPREHPQGRRPALVTHSEDCRA